jgi:hypothetical protein
MICLLADFAHDWTWESPTKGDPPLSLEQQTTKNPQP